MTCLANREWLDRAGMLGLCHFTIESMPRIVINKRVFLELL